MTLQEAIKSGKPFKRKSFFDYYHVKDDHVYADSKSVAAFSVESYLADDWELRPDEPKWLTQWVHPIGHDSVLLIDSRPVKALVEAIRTTGGVSVVGDVLLPVEKLLKESE